MSEPRLVRCAGAIPWRRRRGALEVAVVHRTAYDDWSWAKGRLEDDEQWPAAAIREVREEAGLELRLGQPLPTAEYPFVDTDGRLARKQVRYWVGEVVAQGEALEREVDAVRWLDIPSAHALLDYERDREQLHTIVELAAHAVLTTWPLVVVRHAHARSRATWTGDDRARPLDARGSARARAIAPVLRAFGVTRLVPSSATRCIQTLKSYAEQAGLELRAKASLTEETFAVDPDRAVRRMQRIVERGLPTAVCSHGPVLPTILEEIAALARPGSRAGDAAAAVLHGAADSSMAKGEVLVCHLVGQGDQARLVAAERHRP